MTYKNQLSFKAVAVAGAIDIDGRVIGLRTCEGSIGKSEFKTLLTDISSSVGGKKCYVFLDNLWMHHSKEIKDFAASKRIDLIFNAPMSSELNPIERLWAWSK